MRCFSAEREKDHAYWRRNFRDFKHYLSVNAEYYGKAYGNRPAEYFLAIRYLTEYENSRIVTRLRKLFTECFYRVRRNTLHLAYKAAAAVSRNDEGADT